MAPFQTLFRSLNHVKPGPLLDSIHHLATVTLLAIIGTIISLMFTIVLFATSPAKADPKLFVKILINSLPFIIFEISMFIFMISFYKSQK